MSHAEMQDALGAYADGELDATRRAALEAHLATCAECRAELDALRELTSAIHSQPVPDPGPQYWSRFADRVAARTEPEAAREGVPFYDRLTGWLFPHERFAWGRAATALAACTLLVTLGLRGFRLVAPVTEAPSEIGPPPVAETQGTPEAPPARTPEPSSIDIAQESEMDDAVASGRAAPSSRERTEAPPAGEESRRMRDEERRDAAASQRAPTPAPAPLARREAGPVPGTQPAPEAAKPDAGGVAESFAKAAPEPEATARREAAPERGPFAAVPPPPLAAADSKAETGAALRSEPTVTSERALVPREITVESPAAKGVLESLMTPARPAEPRTMRRAGSPLARVHVTPATPPVDSLLARDARLWPHRDEPAERARIAALVTDLAARADDPRVRPRALAWLEHLVATSPDEAERARWRRMLGSLGDR